MSAQFVAHALSYCLGKGNISLKGKRRRPWLEISRSEVDRTYLSHQLRNLRYSHDQPVDYYADRLATNGFYDLERIRFQGERLWRVYELMYPRDKKVISREILDVVGVKGLTALWLDQGRIVGKRGSIRGKYTEQDYEVLESYLNDIDIPAKIHRNQNAIIQLSIKKDSLIELITRIRPYVHITMKKKLREQKKIK